MSIDLADPASGVTKLKELQSAWINLAALRFAAVPTGGSESDLGAGAAVETSSDVELLDLSGVACPMNFVKTKIKLSPMPVGSQLEVILDDGAPIENVPLSLEEQGQTILAKEKISDRQWKIRVEKSSQI
jgi:sulfite reductase (NADPH) hemoprotein beta-component/sulfite reductase (ferredoxin)